MGGGGWLARLMKSKAKLQTSANLSLSACSPIRFNYPMLSTRCAKLFFFVIINTDYIINKPESPW